MYRELKDGKIRCRDCKEWFDLCDFQYHVGRDGKRRPGSYCMGCKKIRGKRDLAKLRYGISADEFRALEIKYPVCAICGSSQTFIDHDHKTGQIRGRLCRNCNTGIGMFLESPTLLESAKLYLTSFSSSDTLGA